MPSQQITGQSAYPFYCSKVYNIWIWEPAYVYITKEVEKENVGSFQPWGMRGWRDGPVSRRASSVSTRTCPGTASRAGQRCECPQPQHWGQRWVDSLTCHYVAKVLAKTVSFCFSESPSQRKTMGSNTEHTASYSLLYVHVVSTHQHGHTTHVNTAHTKIKFREEWGCAIYRKMDETGDHHRTQTKTQKNQISHFLLCTDDTKVDKTPFRAAVSQPGGQDPQVK